MRAFSERAWQQGLWLSWGVCTAGPCPRPGRPRRGCGAARAGPGAALSRRRACAQVRMVSYCPRHCAARPELSGVAALAPEDAAAAAGDDGNGLWNAQPFRPPPAVPAPLCAAGCARAQPLEARPAPGAARAQTPLTLSVHTQLPHGLKRPGSLCGSGWTAPHLPCWLLSRSKGTQDGIKEGCAVCCSLTTYVGPNTANSPCHFLRAAASRPRPLSATAYTRARARRRAGSARRTAPASASPRARGSGSRRGRRRRRSAPPPAPRRTPPARAASACCRAAHGACSGAPARPAAAAAARAARSTSASSSRRCALPASRPAGDGRPRALCISCVWGVVQSAVLTRPALWAVIPGRARRLQRITTCVLARSRGPAWGCRTRAPHAALGRAERARVFPRLAREAHTAPVAQPAPARAVRGARAAGPGRARGAAGGVRGAARRAGRAHAARRVRGRRGQREPLRAAVRPRRRQEVEDQHLAGRPGRPAGDGAPPLVRRRVLRSGARACQAAAPGGAGR